MQGIVGFPRKAAAPRQENAGSKKTSFNASLSNGLSHLSIPGTRSPATQNAVMSAFPGTSHPATNTPQAINSLLPPAKIHLSSTLVPITPSLPTSYNPPARPPQLHPGNSTPRPTAPFGAPWLHRLQPLSEPGSFLLNSGTRNFKYITIRLSSFEGDALQGICLLPRPVPSPAPFP